VLEIVSSGRTDLAGNAAGSSAMFAILAADAAAPVVTGLIAEANSGVGGDRLLLTFDEQLDLTTALELARYTVTLAGAPVDLTGASLVYSSIAPSIELRLPDAVNLIAGAQVTVALTEVRDLAGNQASATPVAAAVTGDLSPPSSVRGFVNWRAAADGRVIDVEFDEALDEDAANLLRWSTSSGALVQQVLQLAPGVFRVTVSSQLPANATLTLLDPTDLAGNIGGDLAVDPIE